MIVLGEPGSSSLSVGDAVTKSSSKPLKLKKLGAVPAVAVQLTAADIMRLSLQPGLLSITEDAPMASAGYSNPQRWPLASGLAKLWSDVEKAGAEAAGDRRRRHRASTPPAPTSAAASSPR